MRQRVNSPSNCMYRLEYVDGVLIYVIRIDTTCVAGEAINNCPADSCSLKEARQRKLQMQKDNKKANNGTAPIAYPMIWEKFKVRTIPDFDHPIVKSISDYVASQRMGTAGVEIIVDENDKAFVIDFNATNTNYNRAAEKRANMPMRGATEVARMLRRYWLESRLCDN